MKDVITYGIRFILLIAIQILVLNKLDIGFGIHIMIYPLFIILLPFEISMFVTLLLAFGMGILIDSISNTYGLHTSALLLIAYIRPLIFKLQAPRDGYENLKEGNIYTMNSRWILYVFGLLLLIHHMWFFILEIFRFNDFLFVLQNVAMSLPFSFLLCLLFQAMFIPKPAVK